MKQTKKLITAILSISLIVSAVSANLLFGSDVKVEFVEELRISTEAKALQLSWDFCVTEDELFIIPDQGAGNIKIYEKNGTFLEATKILGCKGPGPNDFIEPTYCFYDKFSGRFGVFDLGKRKIFFYDRTGRKDFTQLKRSIYCGHLGYDVHLSKDKLLISGFRRDHELESYDLYTIDISTGEPSFLLPSFEKYGLKSVEEYNTEYHQKPDIKAIGLEAWFDVQDDNVYFVWEGNLRILKLNIRSKEISEFVKEAPAGSNYKKQTASKELLEARKNRNLGLMEKEKYRNSLITNIFVNSNYAFVVFEGPGKSNFWLQFYKLDGTFVNEVRIPGQANRRMWFDKDKDVLYTLTGEMDSGYFISKYKIQ